MLSRNKEAKKYKDNVQGIEDSEIKELWFKIFIYVVKMWVGYSVLAIVNLLY